MYVIEPALHLLRANKAVLLQLAFFAYNFLRLYVSQYALVDLGWLGQSQLSLRRQLICGGDLETEILP